MVDMAPWLITKDQIMAIALRKGWFGVPRYLYRAEPMARKCRDLVKAGKLRRDRTHREAGKDTIVYVPVAALEANHDPR